MYNEFDKFGSIALLKAEAKMRSWSSIYPNAYFMSIFACDRTIYNIQDRRIPRFTPYANDVSSTTNRMRATKD